jgi:hypothetical protein
MYTVEIMAETKGILGFGVQHKYIRIQNRDGVRYEYELDTRLSQDVNVTFNDEVVGSILFRNYRSKNKNTLDKEWEYDTGFSVHINDNEIGILAYYKDPVLYIKKGWNEMESMDKIALYLLIVYENHLRAGS